MTNWNQIEKIAAETKDSFSINAFDICFGDCGTFAKRMADKLNEEGIEFKIVATEAFELMDEMEGYEVETTEFGHWTSHIYLVVDVYGFDAFDVDGEEEREMQYLTQL
jgi:hypothetical protein